MLFSRFVSFMTLGAIAFAIPSPKAEPEKRQLDSALSIVNNLDSSLTSPFTQLDALDLTTVSGTTAVAPLVAEVVAALETASTSLTLLGATGGLRLEKRDDQAEFASKLADVTTKIAHHFGPLHGNKHFSIFGGLLAEVDFALKGLLFEANILVDGILVTVAGLVVGVAVTLQGLLFTLTIALLGIL